MDPFFQDFGKFLDYLFKLIANSLSGSRYWRSRIMVHSKHALKESLSSLPTTELETEAINLWKVKIF